MSLEARIANTKDEIRASFARFAHEDVRAPSTEVSDSMCMIIAPKSENLKKISTTISCGGVIAFRTDTFYGLGGDPFNRAAISRIKELKGREDRKPILIVISDYHQLHRFIEDLSPGFDHLAKTFWPGALTLIGKSRAEVPDEITAGTNSIGVRLPDDEQVCDLVRACGGALTATSANPSHLPPAARAQQVADYFGDRVDLIVDDGEAKSQLPSTVVDAVSQPKLIREGIISWPEIQAALKTAAE